MTSTGFEPERAIAERLVAVAARGEDGKFGPFEIAPPSHPEFYGRGHALYSTAGDCMRFLRMFLNTGALDGARVLSAAGAATRLAHQIGDVRVGKLTSAAPPVSADFDAFRGTPKTHSFGFMGIEQDVPGIRCAGSQGSAGVLHNRYWFDPAKTVAATIPMQPPAVREAAVAVARRAVRACSLRGALNPAPRFCPARLSGWAGRIAGRRWSTRR